MAVILLVFIVAAASAAPSASDVYRDWQQELVDRMEFHKLQEGHPAKRSNYGSYVSPCATAAAASAYAPGHAAPAAYASASPYYGHAVYPTVHAHGYAPSPYAHRYYRMGDDPENEQEMMEMDMNQINQVFDHMPMARSSYGAAPIVNAGQHSGPVVGVFSNANVGGCSVPLLVSCTPSISHGQIAKSQPYYNNYHYNTGAYRDVEENHHNQAEEHQEKTHVSSEQSKAKADKHQ